MQTSTTLLPGYAHIFNNTCSTLMCVYMKWDVREALDIAVVTLKLKSCPRYSSENVRYRRLKLDRDMG